jgi:hypothetical protein
MKIRISFTIIILILLSMYVRAQKDQKIEVRNPLKWRRLASSVVVNRGKLNIPDGQTIVEIRIKKNGGTWSVPFQLDDIDQDGNWDELFFQLNLEGNQVDTVSVVYGSELSEQKEFDKRVHATIETHPRDPWVVYKPAWESELMAYCTYGATQIDCIGKTMPRLTLNYFYGENPHPQHAFSIEYGHDFLLTGNTMAAHSIFIRESDGTIARPWTTNSYSIMKKIERNADYNTTIMSDGPLRTLVRTTISNWQTDKGIYTCELLYSIEAMQRYTILNLSLSNFPGNSEDIQLGAGFKQIYQNVEIEKNEHYLMSVARDVPEAGILNRYIGLGILFQEDLKTEKIDILADPELQNIPNNGPNLGIVFPKGKITLKHAFVAAWEKDGGITSIDQWRKYLTKLSQEFSNPLRIQVLSSE